MTFDWDKVLAGIGKIESVDNIPFLLGYYHKIFGVLGSSCSHNVINSEIEKITSKSFKILVIKDTNGSSEEEGYHEYATVYINEAKKIILVVREEERGLVEKVLNVKGELFEKSMVNHLTILFDINNKDSQKLINEIKACFAYGIKRKQANHINLLCNSDGLYLKKIEIKRKYEIDLELNYGKKFPPVHQKIVDYLKQDNESGLLLAGGNPGTGKTFYLRYLASILDKKIIYVPPNLIKSIIDPSFLQFITEHENSIFIVEDGEEILMKRAGGFDSGVANLLNMTDGILGDCIKTKIICTFNMDIGEIDRALLRKGRLFYQHQFEKLSVEESNRLLKHLKINHIANEPMTLAEIYNLDLENKIEKEEKRTIGFARN